MRSNFAGERNSTIELIGEVLARLGLCQEQVLEIIIAFLSVGSYFLELVCFLSCEKVRLDVSLDYEWFHSDSHA